MLFCHSFSKKLDTYKFKLMVIRILKTTVTIKKGSITKKNSSGTICVLSSHLPPPSTDGTLGVLF